MPWDPVLYFFRKTSTGDLLREILKPVPDPKPNQDKDVIAMSDTENLAVDLVLGNHITDSEFRVGN